MRPVHLALIALLLPLLAAAPVFAEDEKPAPAEPTPEEPAAEEPKPEPKAEPDPEVPLYTIEYLMPGEDAEVGAFEVKDSKAPSGSPTEAGLEKLSEACKCSLDGDNFYVETGVLKGKGGKVGFALVDVDASVWHFRRKLDEAAAAGGWKVSEVGAKGRLLVVGSGDGQAAACEALNEFLVYKLADLGMDRLRGFSGMQKEGRKAAMAYVKAAGTMAPDSGVANAVTGVVHWIKSRPKKRGEKADQAELDKASAAWKKALADGVKYPPKKGVLVFCAGEYGQALLLKKTKSVLPEAKRVLTLAVEHEQDGKNNFRRFGNRYNLACVYARENDVETALDLLKKALETGKSMPAHMFRPQYVNIKDKDPDMANLRDDPRFSKLMADFKPPADPRKKKHP